MKIIGLILARSGSKGLPDKNIKLLNGKPLMSYAIRAAIGSSLKHVYVSSDSQKYLDLAQSYGAQTILRPPELASDEAKSIDAVQHALGQIEHSETNGIGAVCLINACCPLTTSEDIDNMLEMFTDCDSVVSLVEDFSCHASKVCRLDGDRVVNDEKFQTWERQSIHGCYKRNTAIYLANRETIEKGTFFGKNTKGYVMPKGRSWDINDEQDFLIANFLLQHEDTTRSSVC